MPLFHLQDKVITEVAPSSFAEHAIKERGDLQRLLRTQFATIDPNVLIIAEEYANWEDSKRRIDLLGVDRQGNLVVIELKRTEDGGHMELQAIRYAAMASTMTFEQAVDAFRTFLNVHAPGRDAKKELLAFLSVQNESEVEFAKRVRLILVAANFDREITSAVLWLNKQNLDVRCVRLRPYSVGDRLLVDVQQVIPLPEASEYMVRLKQKEQANEAGEQERHILRREFWTKFLSVAGPRTPRFANRTPGTAHWIAAPSGYPGIRYVYCVWQEQSGIELYIDDGSADTNKRIFDHLHAHKEMIEGTYGATLGWERLDDKRACRIFDDSCEIGLRSPREQWADAYQAMIEAMIRIEAAMKPHLEAATQSSGN
jgi:hypothetical protein